MATAQTWCSAQRLGDHVVFFPPFLCKPGSSRSPLSETKALAPMSWELRITTTARWNPSSNLKMKPWQNSRRVPWTKDKRAQIKPHLVFFSPNKSAVFKIAKQKEPPSPCNEQLQAYKRRSRKWTIRLRTCLSPAGECWSPCADLTRSFGFHKALGRPNTNVDI